MNVLIVGLGSIAKKHIAALKEIDSSITIYAIRSSKNASQYENVINLFDFSELDNFNFDFCIISSPTAHHIDNIKALLDSGIPLFIEKPLFSSLDDQNIIEQINEKGTKTYVACNLRFLESLNFVKKSFIDEPTTKINEVNAYCGSYLPDWRPGVNYKKTYSANADMGGGVHIDLIHEIDYIYWLFGSPLKTNKILKNISSLDIDAIDYANFILEFPTFTGSVILNYYRRDAKRYLELVCDTHTVYVDLIENKVYKNNELVFESNQRIINTYKTQLEYFINNINGISFNGIDEAFEVLKICIQ